ncbi:translation initiation factor IF-2 [Prosthecobacter vanneervenii]|uniref:Translation initiation factor IF-2 n=1 Tax=Prosthecobacter vanneervenii TaxID=48466 RepID=A0A7W8DJK5_9BACT|nr:translation initiation factor IF-2 [Prosthecobacter vanneervenii]MBB5031941.1 translation initiation factor IF-2 [Prosthecobacter vanneervenii]
MPPSKPSSSKKSKPQTDDAVGEVLPADSTTSAQESKGKVLSLIEEKKPRNRGPLKETSLPPLGATKKAAEPAPAPAPEPAAPAKPTLDERKAAALNLFEESEKPKRRRPVEEAVQQSALPPISLLKEEPAPPKPIVPIVHAPPTDIPVPEFEVGDNGEKIIHLKPPIIVKDLADKMGLKPFKIISDLIAFKVFASADKAVDIEIAEKICEKHGFKLEREKREKGAGVHKVEEVIVEPVAQVVEEVEQEKLQLRAPIITFMGHVDHGKTSLLDALRKTHVTAGEAGGITQHIGAYCIFHDGRPITFIDTPGHAAFSAMRARGANVTDIVVLVVAADDGIMPQTKEALSHAKAAGVQLMVAINKCDLPTANVMRVKSQLQDIGLAPVDWGGEIECMEVSAKTGLGLDNLLDTMSLQAEVLELKADPKASPRATVIESSMVAGKGPVATVIIGQGTLKVGQPFICGPYWGKVKALINDRGETIKEVLPGMPCEVIGFSDMPHVGDEVVVMNNERDVKKLSEERLEEIRQKKLSVPRRSTLEHLFASIEDSNKKALKIVLKCDVQGSVEAVAKCLTDIPSDKCNLDILHKEVGAINESDVLLASASDAIILGFNVKVENKALTVSKRETVQIKLYSIIYELIDQVKEAMAGLLDPITREKVIGHARVKQVFKVNKGFVGGSVVTDGVMNRKQRARVLRDGQAVYDGGFETLRRFQDEVNEVRNGLECGIKLSGFSDYEENDVIECYELEKIAQTL